MQKDAEIEGLRKDLQEIKETIIDQAEHNPSPSKKPVAP
jgi:hypothetical protein